MGYAQRPPVSTVRAQADSEVRPTPSKPFELKWQAIISGQNYADQQEASELALFRLGLDATYRFSRDVWFKADGLIQSATGRVQSTFEDETEVENFLLREATLNVRAFRVLRLSAGAISQNALGAPTLVSGQRSFPGAEEALTFSNRWAQLEISARQTIPTSTTFANQSTEMESTPTFFNETIQLKLKPHPYIILGGHVTHWAFADLSKSTAADSARFGNTVTPVQGNLSEFLYEYSGLEAGGYGHARLSKYFRVKAGGSFMQNNEAPEGLNQGQVLFGEVELRNLIPGVSIVPRYESIINQADVSPAVFADGDYGYNNRQGQLVRLGLDFYKMGFKLEAAYYDGRTIEDSSIQSDNQYFFINFSTRPRQI